MQWVYSQSRKRSETGPGQSSQWAKLRTIWLVLMHEAGDVHICIDSWGIPLTMADAMEAVGPYPQCASNNPHRQHWPIQPGKVEWGLCPLQVWQVDYVGPLPQAAGKRYLFMAVATATGLGFAWPTPTALQQDTIRALEQLNAA